MFRPDPNQLLSTSSVVPFLNQTNDFLNSLAWIVAKYVKFTFSFEQGSYK